jgi:predicted nucleic acid binding AN1-type Zn finger protein
MKKCFLCNKKLIVCLKCTICNEFYCVKDRLPEIHGCSIENKKENLDKTLKLEKIIPSKVEKI